MEPDIRDCHTWGVPNSFVFPLSVFTMGESKQETSKIYICSFPECGASYNKLWKLDAHLCKHTGLKPFQCEREDCDKSFCTKYHLARHELSHSGDKPYRCTAEGCLEVFTTNSNMKRHLARKHQNKEKTYTCEYEGCGKVFKKNSLLRSHEYEHTNILPYKCHFEGCERSFSVASKLKRHGKVHEGYPCKEEGCSFLGKTWTEYQKHRKEMHRAQLQCDNCSKVFRDSWFLKQHQRVHESERQVFKCPREGCQRTYTTCFNLQNHIISFHEEQKPFSCSHANCGKTFAMKQSLERHSVVHDPERKKMEKKPRPRRSLASRLSGYQPKKTDSSESSGLATLLKDTTLSEPRSDDACSAPQ
ncbi:hypothetical protein SKAU_G00264760 [Synaphobranchus kaupii]|uniref:Transcription factor IIIA n=1 Tax=Synaphobranchus kaupii TaxID=118154 RepID=A0A9Q1EZ35_SYNKA|nr:hypothetical protein SKAU_G00264760 [Synaphobranchus kaupii]